MEGGSESYSQQSTASAYKYNTKKHGHHHKGKGAMTGATTVTTDCDDGTDTNFFQQVWNAIVTFIAGPPVLPNLAFLLLLIAVVFLLAKTIANNEELRLLRGSPRRDVDPFSRGATALRDGRDVIVGERIPQFGSGRFRLGGSSTYEWPVTSRMLMDVTQNPALLRAVDAQDPTDRLCDHCMDDGVFDSEAAQRLCVWALCPGEDGGYCRAFDITSAPYKACRACAASPSKAEWTRGRPPKVQENLPVCVIQTISVS